MPRSHHRGQRKHPDSNQNQHNSKNLTKHSHETFFICSSAEVFHANEYEESDRNNQLKALLQF